jgi:hypothetical protein
VSVLDRTHFGFIVCIHIANDGSNFGYEGCEKGEATAISNRGGTESKKIMN